MAKWSQDELGKIVEADDLKVAPFRDDGSTYGTPTWIWCVSVDDDLYVRAYNGPHSRWHAAALKQKAGRDHRCRDDEGGLVCASQWAGQ